MLCVNTHYPSDPSRGKRPPRSACPTNFEGSRHWPLRTLPPQSTRAKTLEHEFSTHFRALSNAMLSQSANLSRFFHRMLSSHGVAVFFSRILSCLHFPEGFCFLGLLRLLKPPQPCSFLCQNHITLPSLLLQCFHLTLGRRRASQHCQRRTTPRLCNVVDIDTRLPSTHFIFSKR